MGYLFMMVRSSVPVVSEIGVVSAAHSLLYPMRGIFYPTVNSSEYPFKMSV